MSKVYSVKSSAIRAAKAELSKQLGLDKKEVILGTHFHVQESEFSDGGFKWNALGGQTKPSVQHKSAEQLIEETNNEDWLLQGQEAEEEFDEVCRKPVQYNEAGDAVVVKEVTTIQSYYQAVAPLKNTTVVKMVPQNTSTVVRPTKMVWDIADQMKKNNPEVRRKDVINACVEAGIAFNTARTQYQHWFKACKGEY